MKIIPYFGNMLSLETKNFLKDKLKILDIYAFFRKSYNVLFHRRRRIKTFLKRPGPKYLNIGCGLSLIKHKHWMNSDIFYGSVFIDITKPLPFPDNSLDVIFHEHVFEHIPFPNSALLSLQESLRVLKPGGVLRIIMPNFKAYAKEYLKGTLTYKQPLPHLFEESRQMEIMNQLFKQNGEHEFVYDYETCEFLCKKAGFSIVKEQAFNKSLVKGWNFDHWDGPKNLYVEAKKK